MRSIIAILIAAVCLAACRPDNTYTGEPYIHMEYTVDGQHYVAEDWGRLEKTFLGYDMFSNCSGGGLRLLQLDINESVAVFELGTKELSLRLESDRPYFIDGRRYEYFQRIDAAESFLCRPANATVTKGWFSLTRHTTEPYCRYDVMFELHAEGTDGDYEITDGIIQVGRRFQRYDVSSLIKTEE